MITLTIPLASAMLLPFGSQGYELNAAPVTSGGSLFSFETGKYVPLKLQRTHALLLVPCKLDN